MSHKADSAAVVSSLSSQRRRRLLDDDDDDDEEEDAHQHSISFVNRLNDACCAPLHCYAGAVANLCSATLGAGILAVPYALQQAGWICGMLLMVLAAVCTTWSLQLLADASEALQTYSYESLIQHVFGVTGKRWTEACILVFCVGCAVAYVVAVGDILESSILPHSGEDNDSSNSNNSSSHRIRILAMLLVFGGAMLPLSLLPTMKRLQGASSVGVCSILILILSAWIHLLVDRNRENSDETAAAANDGLWWTTRSGGNGNNNMLWPAHGLASVLQACPILLFAFSCQVNVCAIYHEFPRKPHFWVVIWMAVLVCSVLYGTISILTMLDVSSTTTTPPTTIPPNVLQLYCPSGWWLVAFVSMALAVVMAFPLNIFPARVTLEGLLFPPPSSGEGGGMPSMLQEALLLDLQDEVTMEEENERDGIMMMMGPEGRRNSTATMMTDGNHNDTELQQWWRHFGLTLLVAGSAFGLALVVPNISVVFGLLGGTTSSVLGFVLPGCLGIKILGRSSKRAWCLLIGGMVVAVVTTAVTIYGTLFLRHDPATLPDPCRADHNATTTTTTTGWWWWFFGGR